MIHKHKQTTSWPSFQVRLWSWRRVTKTLCYVNRSLIPTANLIFFDTQSNLHGRHTNCSFPVVTLWVYLLVIAQ